MEILFISGTICCFATPLTGHSSSSRQPHKAQHEVSPATPAFKHHAAPVTRNAYDWCPKAITHMLVSVRQRPGVLVSIQNRGTACPDLTKVPDTKTPAFPRAIPPRQQLQDTGTVSRCKDSSQADTTLHPAEQTSIMISGPGQMSWVAKVQAAHYGHQRQAGHGKGDTDPPVPF